MIQFKMSSSFQKWLDSLGGKPVKARVLARLRAAQSGNFGDCESVGNGISEMRIHHGPGYRVYFTRRNKVVYLLLIGGDKSTQKRDIKQARQLAEHLANKEQP